MPKLKNYKNRLDRRTRKLFVVACEGQRSEEIYLRFFTAQMRRVELISLSTGEDGRSGPNDLLRRLQDWKREKRGKTEVEFWMVLDVDHHFSGRHSIRTHETLSEARRCGIQVAVSNPRFELWLLLHFEDVSHCPDDFCEQRLKHHLGGYDHSRYNPDRLAQGLADAIRRAQSLDIVPEERLPSLPSTQMYRLMLAILDA